MLLINKVWPLLIVGISKLALYVSILVPPLILPMMMVMDIVHAMMNQEIKQQRG